MRVKKLTLPTVVEVDDYHYFDWIVELLETFGVSDVKYEEFGVIRGMNYVALFYSSKSDPDYVRLRRELRAEQLEAE